MMLISHRGNLNGPVPTRENSPDYIEIALDKGYNVEIDVWYIGDKWLLGHDSPVYQVDLDFICNLRLLCHAKNVEALSEMLNHHDIHCFWHENDDHTLTSGGLIINHSRGVVPTKMSVCMLPELLEDKINPDEYYGICSDYIERYK